MKGYNMISIRCHSSQQALSTIGGLMVLGLEPKAFATGEYCDNNEWCFLEDAPCTVVHGSIKISGEKLCGWDGFVTVRAEIDDDDITISAPMARVCQTVHMAYEYYKAMKLLDLRPVVKVSGEWIHDDCITSLDNIYMDGINNCVVTRNGTIFRPYDETASIWISCDCSF